MLPVILWHSKPFKKLFRSCFLNLAFALINLYRCLNLWLDGENQEKYLELKSLNVDLVKFSFLLVAISSIL